MKKLLLNLVALLCATNIFAAKTVIWEGEYVCEANWSSALQTLAWGGYDWSSVKAGTLLEVEAKATVGAEGWCQYACKNGSWGDIEGFTAYKHVTNDISKEQFELTQAAIDALTSQGGLVLQGFGTTFYKVSLVTPVNYQEGKNIPFDQWGNILSSAFNGYSDDALVEFCYTATGSEGFVGWGPGDLKSLKGTAVAGAGVKMNIKNEGENKFTYTLEDLKPYLNDDPNAYNQYGICWNLWNFGGDQCINTRKSVTIYEVQGFTGKGYRSPDSEDAGDVDVPVVNTVELTILDIQAAADPSKAFSGKLEGAEKIELNKDEKVAKVATVTDFNGNVIAKVPFTLDGKKVSFTYEDGINRGDYTLTFAENVFSADGELYEKPLSCILAVGKKDDAAQSAYNILMEKEISQATYVQNILIYGVNIYQYAPSTKKKIQKAIDEAEYYGNLLVEEEHIYNTIGKLRMVMKSIRPILPQTDKEYCIKHKGTGLYLNISGEDVVLSKKPTPVQFHLVEPSEGPWCWQNDHIDYGDWEQTYGTYHYSYIYTTPERKYLGFNMTEREVGEGDAKYTEVIPTTTNQKNTIWWIGTNSTNEYYIELPSKYTGMANDLFAPKDSEEGAAVTCYDEDIDRDKEEDNRMTAPGWIWFIEDYIAPEVTETTPEVTESTEEATAISSVEAAANATAIYNAAGARANSLQKGINIIKLADGQVKKVFIK